MPNQNASFDQKCRKKTKKSPSIEMEQTGPVLAGPGAQRDILNLVGINLNKPKLTSIQKEMLTKAENYAAQQSIEALEKKQILAVQLSQQKTLQRNQAILLMCRVYVGSISFDLTEDPIRRAFSSFGPIKTINMSWDAQLNKHKGFAFVEYEIPEAAQLALEQMNGVAIGGRNIQVGRPTNIPQAQPIIDRIMDEAKTYNRIYIASIHPDVNDVDIKTVFEAFGPIKTCVLAPNNTATGNRHKGYGFIQYETTRAAQDAISSMNFFDLAGQNLFVGKAITPPDGSHNMPKAAVIAAAAAAARIGVLSNALLDPPRLVIPSLGGAPTVVEAVEKIEVSQSLEQQEDIVISGRGARCMVMAKLRMAMESRVVVLKNMIGVDDLDEDLNDEVTEECARYGNVGRVVIYQEKESDDEFAAVNVKIFVEFRCSSEAGKARDALNNRYFGGRIVKAEMYDQHMFNNNFLSD
uniref:RRM domain-containing protein n=1 Tax=Strigamia maritima TaxID=126957 RepID=T1J6A6_STRMM